jgi:hypothetical protein
MGVFQEAKAEQAIEALKQMSTPNATVLLLQFLMKPLLIIEYLLEQHLPLLVIQYPQELAHHF